jgi:hypothetical protein
VGPELAELDQFQAKGLNLCQDAEDGGTILEAAGQYGLAAVDMMGHRGKGRECGGPEAAIDSDAIQALTSVHDTIVRGVR